MKIKKFILPFVLLGFLTSCYDDYTSDFETPNMGFAVAKPVRTVIAERDMSIYIGVSIGGKRKVDMNDWAKFVIDPTLIIDEDKALLPTSHYKLSDETHFRVRKSNLPVADVAVNFTDAFYNDPLSLQEHYVLPFRMTENSLGTIRENAESTLAVIKYISNYAGTYYRMGTITEVNNSGTAIGETIAYGNTKDIVKCATTTFKSLGISKLQCPGLGNNNGIGDLVLTIEGDNVSVTTERVSLINATASYKKAGDYDFVAESGKKAPQFDLGYVYEANSKYYRVVEKLVLRQDPEKDLRVETW